MKKERILSAVLAAGVVISMAGCSNAPASSGAESTTSATTSKTESEATEATTSATEESKPEESKPDDSNVPKLDGYNLLWNDEFDGDKLNESIWNREKREPGWTNNELQEYTDKDDNIFIRDGKLVLKAIKSDNYYTSGKVNSQNKTDFTYGKVVVSAKVPEGKGLWPAIWMMPQDESHYGQWPKCGEIDIMEVLGNETNKTYGTIHFGEPHGEHQGTLVLDNGTFADSFHEYSVEWEPGEIRHYVDGNLILTSNDWFSAVEGEDEKAYPAPFDQPFFVQMNLAVGGNWPGNPDDTTDFDKAEFEIDYVRVYQKPSYDTNVEKPQKDMKPADETGNFLTNGDFSVAEDLADAEDWTFYLASGGAGSAAIHDGMIEIKTEAEGSEDYSVQIFQPGLPMVKGKKYRYSFDAYADEARDIIVAITAPTAGWGRYLPDTTVSITTEKKSYSFDFDMTAKTDNNGRAEFNLGHRGSTATVYISNVRVEEIQ